jgi:DNA-binding transcriptional MerR regulator
MDTREAVSYTVSQLAREVGVSADTVRFYEREGLLPAPRRTAAGYRQYDAAMVDRMTFIQGATRLGLSLSDVRDLLAVRDTGVCPCEPAEQHLTKRLAELDAELDRMMRLRAQMAEMLARIPSEDCPPPSPGTWCPPADPSTHSSAKGGEC